jgi:protein-arginine kinase activator protein McsA
MSSRGELEKLTAIKLREIAHEQEGIQGASGMKKEELIVAILKARGEPVKEVQKDTRSIAELKQHIRTVKAERAAALVQQDAKKATRLRKQIKKLKRRTRTLAGQKPAPEKTA